MQTRLGAVYPQTEMAGDPDAARSFADGVADAGYGHLVAYDHVLGAMHEDRQPPLTGPYTQHDPFHDPLVLFAHLSAVVADLVFVPGVLVLAQRQTALAARQIADLAILSGGRVRLGVGVGWNHVEFEALGVAFAERGRRMDEQITLLRELWSSEVVDFSGEFHRVDRAALNPRPPQTVPIWIGGNSDRSLRRAARLGDGHIFSSSAPDPFERLATLQRFVREEGRPIDAVGADVIFRVSGDPQGAARRALDWFDAGGTHVTIATLAQRLGPVGAHLDQLAEVADLIEKG